VNQAARERTPRDGSWRRIPDPALALDRSLASSMWRNGQVVVKSSLIMAELPDRSGVGLQWLISVSRSGKRPKPHEVRRALRAFGMEAAENDAHHPGVARHFFLVVDEAHRVACECKVDEEIIVDRDGYRWTNPVGAREDPSLCRGCEHERLRAAAGRPSPCPIHGSW